MLIAKILREQRDLLLDEWEADVRRSASVYASLSRDDLRDDIPKFLDRLAHALSSATADQSASLERAVDRETTGIHALHRLQGGIQLRQLIHEYRLLRQVVLRHLLACGDKSALWRDLRAFDDALDHAMVESAARYAEAHAEARDTILAIIGHDLRNPLNSISMNASTLLKAGTLSEVESRGVSRIARSADRIKRIVSDLIDLARSRTGMRMPVNLEPFDIGDVAYQAVDELLLSHPDRRIEFHTQGNLRGRWDHVRIGQLVSNLVGNAIHHGRDPITVALVGHETEIEIRVANRGEPIPKEQLPTLFDPYHRASANGPGLGLGLFIVSEIVRGHGGSMQVDSTDDETVFCVRLPRGGISPQASQPSVAAPSV